MYRSYESINLCYGSITYFPLKYVLTPANRSECLLLHLKVTCIWRNIDLENRK